MKDSSGKDAAEEDRRDGWYGRLTHGAPLAVLLAIAFLIGYQLVPVLELVAIAMLLALVLRTFVNRLHRLGIKPWMSVLALFVTGLALGGFVWLVMAPRVLNEIQYLTSTGPGTLNSLATLSQQLNSNFGFFPNLSQLSDRLAGFINQKLGSLPVIFAEAGRIAIDMVAVLFLTLYMSINPGSLVEGTLRLAPEESRGRTREVLDVLVVRLRGWITGTIVAMLMVGTGVGVGLWLIGVPLPLTLGILAGVLELVPYFGQIIAGFLAALLALTVSPVTALLVILLFIVVDQIDAHLIQPLVMGHQVRLHPVVVLISFLFLGRLLGLAGVVLAVPTAALVAVLVDEVISKRDSRKTAHQRTEENPALVRKQP